jgi:hypothetical protein
MHCCANEGLLTCNQARTSDVALSPPPAQIAANDSAALIMRNCGRLALSRRLFVNSPTDYSVREPGATIGFGAAVVQSPLSYGISRLKLMAVDALR